ncbi:MAG: tripartite tricarboxylate transporter substrate-binding protein [Alphaproteobacteria bacterium]
MRRPIPGKLSYGTSGTGSPHHLAGLLLGQKTGIDIQHVPYRGGGAAVNDLLGGHIGMAFLSLSAGRAASFHRQGAHDRHGREDALCGDAGRAGDRRDGAWLRDVVMDSGCRAGRHARRYHRKAQRRRTRKC